MSTPTVFYNGACPVCRREIEHYRCKARRQGVRFDWQDVSTEPDALREVGLDPDTARRRLHVVDQDGRLLAGIPAFRVIWRRLRGFRWLASAVRPGWVQPLATALYEPLALALYRWDQRRRRSVRRAQS
jgi:predicted DCC family thiol-disulfide oxidoreductase YuxK